MRRRACRPGALSPARRGRARCSYGEQQHQRRPSSPRPGGHAFGQSGRRPLQEYVMLGQPCTAALVRFQCFHLVPRSNRPIGRASGRKAKLRCAQQRSSASRPSPATQQQQCPCTQQVRWYAQVIFGQRAQKPVRAATSDQSLLNGTWRGRAAPPRAQGKRQMRLCCCRRVCAAALRLSSAKQQQLRHNRQQQFRLLLDAR